MSEQEKSRLEKVLESFIDGESALLPSSFGNLQTKTFRTMLDAYYRYLYKNSSTPPEGSYLELAEHDSLKYGFEDVELPYIEYKKEKDQKSGREKLTKLIVFPDSVVPKSKRIEYAKIALKEFDSLRTVSQISLVLFTMKCMPVSQSIKIISESGLNEKEVATALLDLKSNFHTENSTEVT